MRVREFEAVFRDAGVRAWLDWNALHDGGIAVQETFSVDRDLLGDLFTVWYLAPDGTPGDWRNDADNPVRVRRASESLAAWPADRTERIERLADEYREYRNPVQLVIPAVSAGPQATVLLDGNHRAVAAYRAGVAVRIFLFVLHGEIPRDLLPDLRHFV